MEHFAAIAVAAELVTNETLNKVMTRAICKRALG
jgi:hypothetical protein